MYSQTKKDLCFFSSSLGETTVVNNSLRLDENDSVVPRDIKTSSAKYYIVLQAVHYILI